MLYGKIVDGVLEKAPNTYTLEDGTIIINFDQEPTYLKREGFKKVVEGFIDYDHNTQELVFDKYVEDENFITIQYKAIKKEILAEFEAYLRATSETRAEED